MATYLISRGRYHVTLLALFVLIAMSGCATRQPVEAATAEPASSVADTELTGEQAAAVELGEDVLPPPEQEFGTATGDDLPTEVFDPCADVTEDTGIVLDSLRRGLHYGVCGMAAWFDSFFGDSGTEPEANASFGRIGVTGFWDQRDHFDPSLRLRAKFALPALKNKLSFTIARDEEDELIEDRGITSFDPMPSSFDDVDDESWLVGLGYTPKSGVRSGFSTHIGVRLRSQLDPYVQAHYRWNTNLGERTILRFRETPFWTDRRGFGATTRLSFDRVMAPRWMLRWANVATFAEDAEGMQWDTGLIAYQNLTNKRALSYALQFTGETGNDVPLQNYGFEVRYRQRILRDWLFAELYSNVTWPKEIPEEERDSNLGVGITFEMYFGNIDEVRMR